MNAKLEIENLLNGDEIEAISLGNIGDSRYREENKNKLGKFYDNDNDKKKALDILNYEFDEGLGLEEGYNICVWSKKWIIIKSAYDGKEEYHKIPRNPLPSYFPIAFGS